MKHLLRTWGLPILAGGTGIAVLLLLARSVENSSQFSRWQPWILLLNIIGVLVLAVLLARKIWQLVRDYRDHVPGSRLTARTVITFGTLVILPLLLVYLFSLGFLNRGIDSWFRVEVKQGLGDALVEHAGAEQRELELVVGAPRHVVPVLEEVLEDPSHVHVGYSIALPRR